MFIRDYKCPSHPYSYESCHALTTFFWAPPPRVLIISNRLKVPVLNLLSAVTVTITVALNTPLGSDGAVIVSVVVERIDSYHCSIIAHLISCYVSLCDRLRKGHIHIEQIFL